MTALLTKDPSVFVHFDPRCDGVVLPPHLRKQPRVVLQYGLNMPVPIPDLEVGEDGLGATLSFARTPTWTFVPWTAVFAIVNEEGQGMLWETEVPREVREEPGKAEPGKAEPGKAEAPGKKGKGDAKGGGKKGARPLLRAVEGGAPKSEREREVPRAVEAPEVASKPSEPPAAVGKPVATPVVEVAAEAAKAPPGVAIPASQEEPPRSTEPAREPRESDEIVEIPETAAKKKRELPPWLRVVK